MNLFKSMYARSKLITAFKEAGIYKEVGSEKRKLFPKIHNTPNEKYDYFVFTLRNGIDPKLLKKNFFVFQQVFGEDIRIDGEFKRFTLTLNPITLIEKVDYDFEQIREVIEKEEIIFPIVCGINEKGQMRIYDATGLPNLLIFGAPGSGKSSILHVILSTLTQLFPPERIEFYLADLKVCELPIYEGVQHVKSVSYFKNEIGPMLEHIKEQLSKRGELLKENKVRHINKLSDAQKPPYIVLCIDEFVMITDEKIMSDLLQIASLGRAYGIYVILSMQRPSHKIISTDVRGILDVRMGFRTVDKRNALIGECPGAETIPKEGYQGTFFLRMDELEQLRSPYIDEDQTEAILEKYKIEEWKNHNYKKAIDTDKDDDIANLPDED